MYTGLAGSGNPVAPFRFMSSGTVAVTNAAAGTLLAGGARESDGVKVNSIPIKMIGLELNNTTSGDLTVILYEVPTGIAANGTGAVQITGSITVPANTSINFLDGGAVRNLPAGKEIRAKASNTGITANASWEQEK